MSLAFTLLSESEHPLRDISIDLNFFGALIAEAESAELEFVLRMAEYYKDAEYEVSELPALFAELSSLETARPQDPHFTENISRMMELVREAQASSLRIMAIAD